MSVWREYLTGALARVRRAERPIGPGARPDLDEAEGAAYALAHCISAALADIIERIGDGADARPLRALMRSALIARLVEELSTVDEMTDGP